MISASTAFIFGDYSKRNPFPAPNIPAVDSPTTLGAGQGLIEGKPVYDLAGRLVAVKQYDGTAQSDTDILTEFTYTYADKTNYLTEKTMDLPTHEMTATYTYGDAAVGEMPDQVYNVYYDSWSSVDYAYDPLGRLTDETFHVAAGYTIDNAYTYLDVNADRTTTLVSSYSTKTGTYAYTYDNVGNITQIVFTPADTTQSAKTITYQYDNLNRLIRENNEIAGKTWFYYYSGLGNICDVQESPYTPAGSFPQERIEVRSHTYGDSTWRDRLTEFNGKAISYDAVGNPTAIGTANLTWQGRTLTQYADGANTYSYEYDMSGHRISKTVNGVETKYYYDGDQLVAQQSGNDRITFMFDANGSAFGFYYNNAPYFFIKNIQGDVTAITNFAGTVIGTYTYDAWGNLIPEASDLSDEVAAMNPIRYRGYYYDAETGYYFLNSRYYDAEMGRFISADGYVSTGNGVMGYNMFAYCGCEPVKRIDPTGTRFFECCPYSNCGYCKKTLVSVATYVSVVDNTWSVDTVLGGSDHGNMTSTFLESGDNTAKLVLFTEHNTNALTDLSSGVGVQYNFENGNIKVATGLNRKALAVSVNDVSVEGYITSSTTGFTINYEYVNESGITMSAYDNYYVRNWTIGTAVAVVVLAPEAISFIAPAIPKIIEYFSKVFPQHSFSY